MTEVALNAFRPVGPSDAIPNDFVVPYYLDDRKLRISIVRVDGRLYAFEGLCTCTDQPCPLSGGLLTGRAIMCQCHGSRFDIATGAVLNGPATKALDVYEVQEVEGSIRIRLTLSKKTGPSMHGPLLRVRHGPSHHAS
jgi:3-phenylpropionate/trans-cinnamate dioxygenase ferredoxin subunit